MTDLASSVIFSRHGIIAYWVTAILLASELLVGRHMGSLRVPQVLGIIHRLD
jgi:hypothetical protein